MSKRAKFLAGLKKAASSASAGKAVLRKAVVRKADPNQNVLSPCPSIDEEGFSAFDQILSRGSHKNVPDATTTEQVCRPISAVDITNNPQLEELLTSPDRQPILTALQPVDPLLTAQQTSSSYEPNQQLTLAEVTPPDRQPILINLPPAEPVVTAPGTCSDNEHNLAAKRPDDDKDFLCKRKLDFGAGAQQELDVNEMGIVFDFDYEYENLNPGVQEIIEVVGVLEDRTDQEVTQDEHDGNIESLIEVVGVVEERTDQQEVTQDEQSGMEWLHEEGHVDQNKNNGTKSRTRNYIAPEKLTRKRQTNSKAWQRNVAKEKLNSGEEHLNTKGQLIKGRKVQPPCDEACRLKCSSNLTEDERQEIHKHFWSIKSHADKWDFIAHNVLQEEKKKNTVKDGVSKRNFSRTYSFRLKGRKIVVCKTMFLKTLDISDGWVSTSMKKRDKNGYISPDKRGSNKPKPKPENEAKKNTVREHIGILPRMASHYTRATSSKEYLVEEITSIADMHAAYLEWMAEHHPAVEVATYRQYCDIFNNEYNISFFLSKKDQCDVCVGYENATDEGKKSLQEEYDKHCLNKDIAQTIRMADTKVAQLMSSRNLCVANFDYQKTLICPRAKASVFYYHRKLSFNNFTIVDSGRAEDYCYCYTETVAAKGSNEVASFVYNFIEMKVKNGITDFRFYSDNCAGQNKNRAILAMYLHAALKFKVHIRHTFLEKGHTWNAADNVHSLIERKIGNRDVYAPEEYLQLIATAKRNKLSPMNIINVQQDQVYDWKGDLVPMLQLDKDEENRAIPWSKLREVTVDGSQDHSFSFKEDLNASAKKVSTKKVGRAVNLKSYAPKKAYDRPLPIAKLKYNDLQQYCNNNLIPAKYHDFYRNLPTSDQMNDAAAAELEEDLQDVNQGRARKRRAPAKKSSRRKKGKTLNQEEPDDDLDELEF